MKQKTKCPVCHSVKFQYLFPIEQGELVRCLDCDLSYYTPRPSPEELHEFYSTENYRCEFAKSLMSGKDFAEKRYAQFEKSLQKYTPQILHQETRQLLDIGCGTGDFLGVACQHGWQISGVEISAEASKLANQMLKRNCVQTGELLSLDLTENYYDVITIFHVVEHLLDPVSILNKISRLLKPTGILFLETPNIGGIGFKISGQKWSHLIPPEHITYFNPKSLKLTLSQAGFEEIQAFTIAPQIIESIQGFPPLIQTLGKSAYHFSCLFGMGPSLQAIAFPKSK